MIKKQKIEFITTKRYRFRKEISLFIEEEKIIIMILKKI